jgi:hypothetical protein
MTDLGLLLRVSRHEAVGDELFGDALAALYQLATQANQRRAAAPG